MRVPVIKYVTELSKISTGFVLQGLLKEFDLWNVFNNGLYGVQFVDCLRYKESTVSRVNCVYEFAKLSPHI